MKKGLVKKGQIWREKVTGRRVRISNKASGNMHWSLIPFDSKTAHHIHEGTLQKYYELLPSQDK